MTLLVALCGLDAAGKSKHTDALADALRAQGVRAHGWHHAQPSPAYPRTPWAMALWYAAQRAIFAADMAEGVYERAEVIVCDRWVWSTYVVATSQPEGAHADALWDLQRAEREMLPPAAVVLLTAPREVIEARLLARPEVVPETMGAAMLEYADLALYHEWPVVSTDRDAAAVTADLVAIVRGLLTAAVPQGVCPAPTEGL